MAASRVILPLASAKALLDRDLEQGKIPDTTKLDIAWDFDMAQMIGVELPPTEGSEESFHLSQLNKYIWSARYKLWSYESPRERLYHPQEAPIKTYLRNVYDEQWESSGPSVGLLQWFYGAKLGSGRRGYTDKVKSILEGDFCKWVRGLDPPWWRLRDPDLVESIDWVVRRREEAINDVDYALKLGMSIDDKDLAEPLRLIDAAAEVALESLVKLMREERFNEYQLGLAEEENRRKRSRMKREMPSQEETSHRLKLQTGYFRGTDNAD